MVTQYFVTVGHIHQETWLGAHSTLMSIPGATTLPTPTSKRSSLTSLTCTFRATLTLALTLGVLTFITPVTSRRSTIGVLNGYCEDKKGQCDDQSLHLK